MEPVESAPQREPEPPLAAAMLIEVLDTHGRAQTRQRVAGAGTTCKIGRSLNCDIVLDDAYAAAEHTAISLLEDGRVAITDLGSRNGTRINSEQGSQRLSNASAVLGGAQLIVGRTRLRIRTHHTALTPERLFQRDLLQRNSTLLAGVGFLAVIALVIANEWLQAPERLAPKILTAILAVTIVIAAWTGLWALITRIAHGVWSLRLHVAIACNAAAVVVAGIWLFSIAEFATQWSWLDLPKFIACSGAVLAALFLHLHNATHLRRRTAAIVTAIVPLLLIGAMAWIQQQSESRNVNRIAVGTAIFPPQFSATHGMELTEYLSDVEGLRHEANRKRQQSLIENPLVSSR